jgi:hypothetical protein
MEPDMDGDIADGTRARQCVANVWNHPRRVQLTSGAAPHHTYGLGPKPSS